MITLHDIRRAEARRYFREFVAMTWPNYIPNRFHDVLCARLQTFYQQLVAGDMPKLLVTIPPRHGKSWIASQRFPVWVLGQQPDLEIIMASYSSLLATDHSRMARRLLNVDKETGAMEPAADIFRGLRLDERKRGVENWYTTKGGKFRALGMLGSATGAGASLLVIDDPIKGFEEASSETTRNKIYETYHSDLQTRLAPNAGTLLIQTRWHEDDLAGRLLAEEGDEWTHINFPAIAETDEYVDGELFRREGEALVPERYPVEKLERFKRNPRTWSALFQQRPAPADGDIVKREWFQYYDEIPASAPIITSWDLTFTDKAKSDYVAGLVFAWFSGELYLIDGINKRMGFQETIDAIKTFHAKYPNTFKTIIEDKANGPAVMNTLAGQIPNMYPYNPGRADKTSRLHTASAHIMAGRVKFPKLNELATKLINQCCTFPQAAHDDLMDAMTQAVVVQLGSPSLASLYELL